MNHLNEILALMPPPQQGQGQQQQSLLMTFAPFILLLVIFYFLLIRPQQKRAKQQAQLLKNLRPGDRVVTAGGIVGVIITVKDKTVSLRSADAKMEVTKASVTDILERDNAPAS
jgi:preprotein translocase subunit YajC